MVLGAGGHGTVVADILLAMADNDPSLEVVGFLDDGFLDDGTEILGLRVLGPLSAVNGVDATHFTAAIGDNRLRARLFQDVVAAGQLQPHSAVHPSAVLGREVKIHDGAMICAGAVINPDSVIGANAIVNTSASVDHHCHIAEHALVAPGVHMGGKVTVGEGALVGVGASVVPGCTIGDWAVVGAGAAVTSDVAAEATVVGVPARPAAE